MQERQSEITSRLTESTPTQISSATRKLRGKVALAVVAIAILGLVVGTLLSATGSMEFVIGVRYNQQELDTATEKADKKGFDRGDSAGYSRGYSAGNSDGYAAGQSAGYSSGFDAGCNAVFDKIGENLIAIRSPWRAFNIYGYYWPRGSVC
jgi:hypothetical protein